jgi:hypothetical protein
MHLSKPEYDKLLADAKVCEDSGHVFEDGETRFDFQKSLDRIDNTKGYEMGNVRVVVTRANMLRGSIDIDAWRAAAAVMREKGLW